MDKLKETLDYILTQIRAATTSEEALGWSKAFITLTSVPRAYKEFITNPLAVVDLNK